MIITKVSLLTGNKNRMDIDITAEEYSSFLQTPKNLRPNIQDLFPNLDSEEREFLLTGSTPEEWESMPPEE